MKNRLFAGIGLLFIDFSVFIVTIAFLPRNRSFGFNGPWSHFVNSRTHWDTAWTILAATLVFSLGLFLVMEGCGIFNSKILSK